VITGGMTGAQELLGMWYQKAQQDYSNSSPQQAAPFALLVNYMVNPAIPVSQRWSTFALYVQQQVPPAQQALALSAIVCANSPNEDNELKAWSWAPSDKQAAVKAMAADSSPASQYLAYEALGKYTYKGKPLPVKVGATVALQYVKALPQQAGS
jgi:hypothetical protein